MEDGFAWTSFGYDWRIILALSRNDSPGPMYGKGGLPYELGAIQELWQTRQHFALHHDLTNCLRIADLTEFTADGQRLFHEIKAKPHTEKKQLERAQAVVDAINSGGVLPSSTGDSRLVELQEPYVTNLKQLNDLLQLAKRNGSRGMKLPQGRAIVASSRPTMIGRFRNDMEAVSGTTWKKVRASSTPLRNRRTSGPALTRLCIISRATAAIPLHVQPAVASRPSGPRRGASSRS